jgi:hypothetical protein
VNLGKPYKIVFTFIQSTFYSRQHYFSIHCVFDVKLWEHSPFCFLRKNQTETISINICLFVKRHHEKCDKTIFQLLCFLAWLTHTLFKRDAVKGSILRRVTICKWIIDMQIVFQSYVSKRISEKTSFNYFESAVSDFREICIHRLFLHIKVSFLNKTKKIAKYSNISHVRVLQITKVKCWTFYI